MTLKPVPGDVVRLDGPYMGVAAGARAVIDGGPLTDDVEVLAVCAPSAFRGASRRGGAEYVSVSGGPCPLIPVKDLTYEGTTTQRFWRWLDRPRKGGGIDYELTVNLWSWTPKA